MKTLTKPPFSVTAAVEKMLADDIKAFPVASNTASKVGHPCERLLYLRRIRWQDARPITVRTKFIFERGKGIERYVIGIINDTGRYAVTETDLPVRDEKYKLSGRLDGKIHDAKAKGKHPQKYPLEVKSMNEHIWASIETADDMLKSEKPWVHSYPAQLQTYMFLTGETPGLFILVNASTWQFKEIWMEIDYDYCEWILQRCERINKRVDLYSARAEEPPWPDPIPWDGSVCPICDYNHICLPTIEAGGGLALSDDPEVKELLDRRAELQENSKEYAKVDKRLKDKLKHAYEGDPFAQLMIGNWMIAPKTVAKESYVVPAGEYTQFKFSPVRAEEMEE